MFRDIWGYWGRAEDRRDVVSHSFRALFAHLLEDRAPLVIHCTAGDLLITASTLGLAALVARIAGLIHCGCWLGRAPAALAYSDAAGDPVVW